MHPRDKLLPVAITFLVATPAGFLLYLLRIPLPWLLGPIVATFVYNHISRNKARWPLILRELALIVVGYSMGRTISFETTRQIFAMLPSIAAVTLLTLTFSLVVGYYTHQKTGISLASSLLGSMPGGMLQMVLLVDEVRNADITVVIFMQTIRVLTVIFMVPFVATYGVAHFDVSQIPAPAGPFQDVSLSFVQAILIAPLAGWLARRLKLPIPFLLGPIIGTAALVLCGFPAPAVPRAMFNTAQVFVGIYLGLGVTSSSLKKLGGLFSYSFGGSAAMVAFAFVLGYVLTIFIPATLLTTFLGTAPGGMAEMGVTAIALDADIATVLAYQLFRLFSILLAVPPVLKWWLNRK
jgi:uncharacterized protein